MSALYDTEKRLKRYEALAKWCRWLRKQRPDLYKHIDFTFTGLE